MAYYKVPQDVEAEDKLIGPFTFKQFVFLIVFFISGFVGFRLLSINIALTGFVLPVFIVSGVLGFYRPNDQPVETKLLAYINFYFKPRVRLWSRDGILEHVLIQAPKRVERAMRVRTREEVQSQLKQLSQIIDTRGWVTKQTTVQMPVISNAINTEDRLITPQQVRVVQDSSGINASDDVMDGDRNPLAQNLTQLAEVAEEQAREDAIDKMQQAAQAAPARTSSHTPTTTAHIEKVHPLNPSHDSQDTSTPLIPHFDPFPTTMHQTRLDPAGRVEPRVSVSEEVEKVVALASEMSDQPLSAVATQAEHITHPQAPGLEFRVDHTKK
jgi:hypothetical protein